MSFFVCSLLFAILINSKEQKDGDQREKDIRPILRMPVAYVPEYRHLISLPSPALFLRNPAHTSFHNKGILAPETENQFLLLEKIIVKGDALRYNILEFERL